MKYSKTIITLLSLVAIAQHAFAHVSESAHAHAGEFSISPFYAAITSLAVISILLFKPKRILTKLKNL